MDVSDEDLLGPTPAPIGSGRGGDPRQFMDQPAPYRDPIMDMVGTNLGGGGGYAWMIGAALGAIVHLAISSGSKR